MVTTLVGYVVVRLGVTKLRPISKRRLRSARSWQRALRPCQELPGSGAALPPHLGDWVLSSNVLSASGNPSTKRSSPVPCSSGQGIRVERTFGR